MLAPPSAERKDPEPSFRDRLIPIKKVPLKDVHGPKGNGPSLRKRSDRIK